MKRKIVPRRNSEIKRFPDQKNFRIDRRVEFFRRAYYKETKFKSWFDSNMFFYGICKIMYETRKVKVIMQNVVIEV